MNVKLAGMCVQEKIVRDIIRNSDIFGGGDGAGKKTEQIRKP